MFFFGCTTVRTFVSSKIIGMRNIITFICNMKKAIAVCLLLLSATSAVRSQYITIPDTGFAGWLTRNGYAACLSGNQLDTNCITVLNATIIDIGSGNIHDLTGISYFKNLHRLICVSTGL